MGSIPVSALVGGLATVILAGSLVAHRNRRRRIAQFGDAAVLGLVRRRYSWIIAPLLTSSAAGFAAATLVLQPAEQGPQGNAGDLEIVIDAQFAKGPTGADAAVEVSDAIRAVVSQSPPGRLSVSLSGDPAQLLIPPTSDAQGVLVVMDGSSMRETPAADSTAAQRDRRQSDAGTGRVVYVTSQQPDDVENTLRGVRGHHQDVAFVVVTAGSGGLLFGTYDRNGSLSWSASPLTLHEFLTSERVAKAGIWSWLQNFSAVQGMALLGFASLAAGSLWSHFRP